MDKNYILLGQLYKLGVERTSPDPIYEDGRHQRSVKRFSISQHRNQSTYDVQKVLEKSGYDLNYQIPHGSPIVNRNPEWLGYTLLHFAVQYKKEDVIELLISRGVNCTLRDGDNSTPLGLAFNDFMSSGTFYRETSKKILDLLLRSRIRSNNVINQIDKTDMSLLHVACFADSVSEANLLLKAGISINETVTKDTRCFSGWSPLHIAVRYGSKSLIKLLLKHGADMNQVDGNGLTPLFLLVERSMENNGEIQSEHPINEFGYQSCYRISNAKKNNLLDLFIKKDSHENVADVVGLSVFHVSCTLKDTTLAEKFLELGADTNLKINLDSLKWPGYTPTHFAAQCNLEIFKLLVKKGADILAKDKIGITPIDLLIKRYKLTFVGHIIKLHPTLLRIELENCIKLVKGE